MQSYQYDVLRLCRTIHDVREHLHTLAAQMPYAYPFPRQASLDHFHAFWQLDSLDAVPLVVDYLWSDGGGVLDNGSDGAASTYLCGMCWCFDATGVLHLRLVADLFPAPRVGRLPGGLPHWGLTVEETVTTPAIMFVYPELYLARPGTGNCTPGANLQRLLREEPLQPDLWLILADWHADHDAALAEQYCRTAAGVAHGLLDRHCWVAWESVDSGLEEGEAEGHSH